MPCIFHMQRMQGKQPGTFSLKHTLLAKDASCLKAIHGHLQHGKCCLSACKDVLMAEFDVVEALQTHPPAYDCIFERLPLLACSIGFINRGVWFMKLRGSCKCLLLSRREFPPYFTRKHVEYTPYKRIKVNKQGAQTFPVTL